MSGRKLALAGGLLAAVLLAVSLASPYWAVRRMRSALDARDGDRLADYVDFPAVRESMRRQLTASFLDQMKDALKDNPFAASARALAAQRVDALVEAAVTPEGLARLVDRARPVASGSGREPRVTQGYRSLDTFEVVFAIPDSERPLVLGFRRDGLLGWKLRSVRVPLPEVGEAANAGTERAR